MSRISATVRVKMGDVAGWMAKVSQGIYDGVSDGAAIVEFDAKMHCSMATGDLAESIHTTVTRGIQNITRTTGESMGDTAYGVTAVIQPEMPYADFVEYGTGIRGSGTYPYELPTEGVPFTGSWIYDFRGRGWVGHAAQPFMRPAADNNRDAVVTAIEAAVKNQLA